MIEQGIGERIYRSRQRNWWLSAAVLLASAGLAAILARRLLLGEAGLAPMLLFVWVAIAVVGFTIGCWLYWRTVDELEVKDNLWGGIAGLYAYMISFPAWWLLWRGGAAPAPNAWAIYLASLGIATVVYLVRRAASHIYSVTKGSALSGESEFMIQIRKLARCLSKALGFTILAASLAQSAEGKAAQAARPALWAVSDADTTVYLFGTIHLLPSDMKWRTAKIDQAMTNSQQLVVETVIDEKNPTKLMSAMASLGLAKGLPPVLERVPPAQRPALAAAIKKSGVPETAYNSMKTWMAAFLLLSNQFKELGLSGGVEGVLRADFLAHNKPIGELETNLEQLSFFDKLPESAQRNLLEGAIEGSASMKREFGGMLDSWARGDVKGIARTFDKDLATSPELRDTLIRERNTNWSKWIERRMTQPGAVLVAVGAGHLAGPYSVIENLKKGGYKVRRVE